MRWLVWSLLTFALAVGVALAARFNHGNVALLWPPYRVDLSVNLALLFLAVLFVLMHLALIGMSGALRLPARVREYRERRILQRAAAAFHDALLAFLEGRFGRAERLAQAAQQSPAVGGLAALVAARAAHRMREFARSEQWLQRADSQPGLRNAQLMTRAELAIEQHEAAAAIAAVDALHRGGARHIQSLRIALRAHEQARDWHQVLRLVSQLEKRQALHPVAARQLRTHAYGALFASRDEPDALRKLWAGVPAAERTQPQVAALAADAFARARDVDTARRLLESALDAAWSEALAERYIALPAGAEGRGRLDRVEAWRERYGDEPGLLRALGELCLAERLWGKAQSTLEQALAREPSAATHLALARLFEATDRPGPAAHHYRESALLAARPVGPGVDEPVGGAVSRQTQRPPSTSMQAPVMKSASSEAR